jgi:hypothetical protein
MIKKCKLCGKEFVIGKENRSQRYCSDKCFMMNRRKSQIKIWRIKQKALLKQHNIIFKRNCIICNKEFIGKDFIQRCCSKKCSTVWKKKLMKDYNKTYAQSNNCKKLRSSLKYKRVKAKYKNTKRFQKMNKESQYKYRHSQKGRNNYLRGSMRRIEAVNNSIQNWTPEEYQIKLLKTKGFCITCNKPYSKTRIHMDTPDHTFSVIRAGDFYKKYKVKWIYTIDGIIPMGFTCNIIKNDKVPKHIEKILQLDDPTTLEEATKIIKRYELQVNEEFENHLDPHN